MLFYEGGIHFWVPLPGVDTVAAARPLQVGSQASGQSVGSQASGQLVGSQACGQSVGSRWAVKQVGSH